MSPAETKKTKRRKNKKVARSTGKEQIEGVGMSAGVGSANPCIGQSAKDAGVLDLTLSASLACGPKELQGCILCSRTHSTGSAADHAKDAVDIFGPEVVWDSLPSDALCSSEALFSEDIDLSSALRDGTFPKELLSLADDCGSPVCVCERYSNWKALEPEADQQELLCWQVVKQALHRKYQGAGLGSDAVPPLRDDEPLPTDAEVRAMVSRLRRRDPQQLLQCLKYQAHLFVVESRLRMLRHLVAGRPLEDALVAEYAKLRLAWEGLDPLLEELLHVYHPGVYKTWDASPTGSWGLMELAGHSTSAVKQLGFYMREGYLAGLEADKIQEADNCHYSCMAVHTDCSFCGRG